jgi:hypothetical protein
MTPFGHRLQTDLEIELVQINRQWLFRWFGLTSGHLVEVEDFLGGRITYQNLEFSGSPELVYWAALGLYLRKTISSTFDRAEVEVRLRPKEVAAIANDAALLLNSFSGRLFGQAFETARRLKGRGFPPAKYNPPPNALHGYAGEIEARKVALVDFYSDAVPSPTSSTATERRNIFLFRPAIWGIGLDLNEAFQRFTAWWHRRS